MIDLFENKVEPTSGFRIDFVVFPPVSPEVIQIQVLWTFALRNPASLPAAGKG